MTITYQFWSYYTPLTHSPLPSMLHSTSHQFHTTSCQFNTTLLQLLSSPYLLNIHFTNFLCMSQFPCMPQSFSYLTFFINTLPDFYCAIPISFHALPPSCYLHGCVTSCLCITFISFCIVMERCPAKIV